MGGYPPFLFRRDEVKFYGNGIVWNAQANRPLCRFIKGEFITEDEGVVKTLTELGYKHDEPPIIKTIETVETEPVKFTFFWVP